MEAPAMMLFAWRHMLFFVGGWGTSSISPRARLLNNRKSFTSWLTSRGVSHSSLRSLTSYTSIVMSIGSSLCDFSVSSVRFKSSLFSLWASLQWSIALSLYELKKLSQVSLSSLCEKLQNFFPINEFRWFSTLSCIQIDFSSPLGKTSWAEFTASAPLVECSECFIRRKRKTFKMFTSCFLSAEKEKYSVSKMLQQLMMDFSFPFFCIFFL